VNVFPPVTYVISTGNKYVIMSNKGNNKITELRTSRSLIYHDIMPLYIHYS